MPLFDDFQFSRALETVWSLVGAVNRYIVENEPVGWSRRTGRSEPRSRLATILYTTAEALRIVTALAHPVIPESTARIWEQLGLGDISDLSSLELNLKWGRLAARHKTRRTGRCLSAR